MTTETRAKMIKNGELWMVHNHEDLPEKTYFEGTRAACIRWMKEHDWYIQYKKGKFVRLGQIVYEWPRSHESLYDSLRADDFNNEIDRAE